ncbi:hypothetical protein CK507_04870 [Pseudomonas sp. WN033]|nr:hypothetical protein CK507_04870 [Pseudomonas sp. WN033]
MLTPMIILAILITPLAIAFAYASYRSQPLEVRRPACYGMGLAFAFFAIGHFVQTEGMVAMLPAWVPWRLQLVYLTGVLELLIAIGFFLPDYRELAAKLAIAVLILFFPANVYAALHGVGLGGHQWGPVYLLIRAPLQIVLIFWAYVLCLGGRFSLLQRSS